MATGVITSGHVFGRNLEIYLELFSFSSRYLRDKMIPPKKLLTLDLV